jgi:hypothetical protein
MPGTLPISMNDSENLIIPKYYNPNKSNWSRMMKNAVSKNL